MEVAVITEKLSKIKELTLTLAVYSFRALISLKKTSHQ